LADSLLALTAANLPFHSSMKASSLPARPCRDGQRGGGVVLAGVDRAFRIDAPQRVEELVAQVVELAVR
jgi:hypothetical protein